MNQNISDGVKGKFDSWKQQTMHKLDEWRNIAIEQAREAFKKEREAALRGIEERESEFLRQIDKDFEGVRNTANAALDQWGEEALQGLRDNGV